MGVLTAFLTVGLLLSLAVSAKDEFSGCTYNFPDGFVPTTKSDTVQLCSGSDPEGQMAISYSTKLRNPWFSARFHKSDDVQKVTGAKRPSTFKADPALRAAAPSFKQPGGGGGKSNDYAPYDKGHLTPNSIMTTKREWQLATFTVTNIAAQNAGFNQGAWQRLEKKVQTWIVDHGDLYVITGTIFSKKQPAHSNNGLVVPDYYFKVICDLAGQQSAGFLGQNTAMPQGERNQADITKNKRNDFGTEAFHTVEFIEKQYGGKLFPEEACNTQSVDESHWWGEGKDEEEL